jgi:hypothetical protein
MKVHLNQEIAYQEAEIAVSTTEQTYQEMLAFLDKQDVGTELCIALSSTLQPLFCGVQESPDEATRSAVEQALELPKVDSAYQIGIGTYTVSQFAPPRTFEEIKQYIPHLIADPNRVHLRLIKENALTIIAQIWISN